MSQVSHLTVAVKFHGRESTEELLPIESILCIWTVLKLSSCPNKGLLWQREEQCILSISPQQWTENHMREGEQTDVLFWCWHQLKGLPWLSHLTSLNLRFLIGEKRERTFASLLPLSTAGELNE